MKIQVTDKAYSDLSVDLAVVGVYADGTLARAARQLDKALGGHLARAAREEMKGAVGESVLVHTLGLVRPKRVLLVGLGAKTALDAQAARSAGLCAGRTARATKGTRLACAFVDEFAPSARALAARACVEGVVLGTYSFTKYFTDGRASKPADTLVLAAGGDTRTIAREAERGRVMAEASCFARDMIAEPANVMTPQRMADIARRFRGVAVRVYDERAIERMGMGALRGVSIGSAKPPRFIRILYRPAGAARNAPIDFAFVGKGITFDSGGINLKPTEGIAKMKYDMSGGAAVLAVMRALPQLKPNVTVLGLIPCTENMPSGSATKPGDILHTLAGKTVEVENTDAEGRLILADALAYGVNEGARALIDVATLTGAVLIALGRGAAGLMSNNDDLTQTVQSAADKAGERFWRLPLYDDYLQQTKSEIADLKNTGGRDGGTITAGLFLQEFVSGRPWVHMDIASTAWSDAQTPMFSKGPTGFAVRTLLNVAMDASSARPRRARRAAAAPRRTARRRRA